MIADTSALVAIVFTERTPSLVETGMVLSTRLGDDASALTGRLLEEFDIVPVVFTEQHWSEAVKAFQQYGRGRHRARLDVGDCLSYAVAKVADEPLLFVGEDFPLTDIVAA